MPKTLVTGATGFIGSRVARRLLERGDDLRLAVEPGVDAPSLDAESMACDVRDRRAVRRALKGVERVFHAAGVTSIRPADAERVFAVNVGGTKVVMEECLRAGVERVVMGSSAAALGPAPPGGAADETQLFTAGRLGIPYLSSVHEAEVEAMRVAAKGLPLVCVNPTFTFGAGDSNLTSTRVVRTFLLGRIPVYVDGAVSVVDADDAAAGHLLADERGAVGERYILGGRKLHLGPAIRRPGPAVGRRAAGEGPGAARRRRRGSLRARRAPPGRGAGRESLVDLQGDEGAARARLAGSAPRGDV